MPVPILKHFSNVSHRDPALRRTLLYQLLEIQLLSKNHEIEYIVTRYIRGSIPYVSGPISVKLGSDQNRCLLYTTDLGLLLLGLET